MSDLEERVRAELHAVAEASPVRPFAAVIEEIRRRGNRERARRAWALRVIPVIGVAAAVVLVWSLGFRPASNPSGGTTVATSPRTTMPSPTAPYCRSSDLSIVPSRPVSPMTQEIPLSYQITRVHGGPCLLQGRPTATFFDRNGSQVQLTFDAKTQYVAPSLASRGPAIRLGDHTRAYLLVAKNACVGRDATHIVSARLRLPHGGGALNVPTTGQRFFSCAQRDDPGRDYTVSAFNTSLDFVTAQLQGQG